MRITERSYGGGDVRRAQAGQNLGRYLSDAGRHAQALRHLHDALAVKEKVFGKMHIECARVRNLLGMFWGFFSFSFGFLLRIYDDYNKTYDKHQGYVHVVLISC